MGASLVEINSHRADIDNATPSTFHVVSKLIISPLIFREFVFLCKFYARQYSPKNETLKETSKLEIEYTLLRLTPGSLIFPCISFFNANTMLPWFFVYGVKLASLWKFLCSRIHMFCVDVPLCDVYPPVYLESIARANM